MRVAEEHSGALHLRRARLASCRAAAAVRSPSPNLFNGTAKQIVQHEATRSAGAAASPPQRRTDRSAIIVRFGSSASPTAGSALFSTIPRRDFRERAFEAHSETTASAIRRVLDTSHGSAETQPASCTASPPRQRAE